jgi:hypothetical protein
MREDSPGITISVDSSCSISIDTYMVTRQDKRGRMVLERNRIGRTVLSPVFDIRREPLIYQHFILFCSTTIDNLQSKYLPS